MTTAAVLFTLTALGGAVMAGIRLKGEPYPPLWLALGHGAGGVAGLAAMLGYAWSSTGVPDLVQYAFYTFAATAVGGVGLFTLFHLRGKPLPVGMMLGHGAVALAGLALLWTVVLRAS